MCKIKKILAFWRDRSLRFWLATGMLMTLSPIFISAVAGYFFYHQAIIRPLVEVSSQQRRILQPLQSVRLSVDDISDALVDYSIDGESRHAVDYKQLSDGIEASLAILAAGVTNHAPEVLDVNKVWGDWRELANFSRSILSGESLHGSPQIGQRMEDFEARVDRLDHHLAKVYDDVDTQNEQMHVQILADLEFSQYLAVAAFVVSITCAILGVGLINRSLVSSMDKLAAGALRLAAGDREHNIEVHVPRELVNVADAFNLNVRRRSLRRTQRSSADHRYEEDTRMVGMAWEIFFHAAWPNPGYCSALADATTSNPQLAIQLSRAAQAADAGGRRYGCHSRLTACEIIRHQCTNKTHETSQAANRVVGELRHHSAS